MEEFGRLPGHGVTYAENLRTIALPELLRLSQVNVTPDRIQGLHYAAASIDVAAQTLPDYDISYGKAAALFGFRVVLNGGSATQAGKWFTRSINHLQTVDEKRGGHAGLRESIATNILEGRSFDYMSLKPKHIRKHSHDAIESSKIMAIRAHHAYLSAEQKISELHMPGTRWDAYAVMAPKFHAVHESLQGNTSEAALLALSGIHRALHAAREEAGLRGRINHERFVAKQLMLTNRVLAFCMATPLNRVPEVLDRRLDFARVIFSGSRDNSMRAKPTPIQ